MAERITRIIKSIEDAERNGVIKKSNFLSGYSGEKIIGVLQRLANLNSGLEDTCYLEVGVFQGLTLLSTAYSNPTLPCYGIDNFAFFDPQNENFSLVKKKIKKLDLNNVNIINKDYEDAFENLKSEISDKKIVLYFIDGPHDYRSQLMCLLLVLPYLHKNSIIVIDDCNYEHVRQANKDFLKTHPTFKLLFEAYTTSHPKNMSDSDIKVAKKGWWNGINVIVKDSSNLLPAIYPETTSDRTLFLNEHIIHASKYAELAPKLLRLLGSITNLNLRRSFNYIRTIGKTLLGDNKFSERYEALNTSTKEIGKYRINKIQ